MTNDKAARLIGLIELEMGDAPWFLTYRLDDGHIAILTPARVTRDRVDSVIHQLHEEIRSK